MRVRPLIRDDTVQALALYRDLSIPGDQFHPACFHAVLDHPGTTVLGTVSEGRLLGMLTLHLLPNVTRGGRPYALIENVVTHPDHRGQGIGRITMQAAIDRAWAANAYKIMLLTGRQTGAKGFYQALGFDGQEKHGMVLRQP